MWKEIEEHNPSNNPFNFEQDASGAQNDDQLRNLRILEADKKRLEKQYGVSDKKDLFRDGPNSYSGKSSKYGSKNKFGINEGTKSMSKILEKRTKIQDSDANDQKN